MSSKSMNTKWDDKSWQKDFLNMKSHSPSDAKLLMGGVKGLKDAWRLGVLHVEYERLKKIQEEQQQQWQKNQLQKEFLESGKLSDKYSKNHLKHRAEDFMQEIYLGYIYSRYRKIRILDKYDPLGNAGQIQSSFKEFEKRVKWRWWSLKPERV